MTEPIERDTVVADALRQLPVPDHGPGFWADLERRLDLVDAGRDDDLPAPRAERVVVPMVSVPPDAMPQDLRIAAEHRSAGTSDDVPAASGRPDGTTPESRWAGATHVIAELPAVAALRDHHGPTRRHTLRWLGAAAAVLVVGTGIALTSIRDGDGTDDLADPTPDTEATSGATREQLPQGATVPGPVTTLAPIGAIAGQPDPETAVRTFVDSMGRGDFATAATLLGPESREYLEAIAGPDLTVTDVVAQLAEGGPGAFADIPTEYTTVELADLGFGQIDAVVIDADAAGRGVTSAAFATIDSEDGWLVEWQGFDPSVADSAPAFATGPGEMPIGSEVGVFWDAPGSVAFLVDGDLARLVGTVPLGDDPAPFAKLDITADLDIGAHVLYIVFMSDTAVYATGPYDLEVIERP